MVVSSVVDMIDSAREFEAVFSWHIGLLFKYGRPGKSFAKVGIEGIINLFWVWLLPNSPFDALRLLRTGGLTHMTPVIAQPVEGHTMWYGYRVCMMRSGRPML